MRHERFVWQDRTEVRQDEPHHVALARPSLATCRPRPSAANRQPAFATLRRGKQPTTNHQLRRARRSRPTNYQLPTTNYLRPRPCVRDGRFCRRTARAASQRLHHLRRPHTGDAGHRPREARQCAGRPLSRRRRTEPLAVRRRFIRPCGMRVRLPELPGQGQGARGMPPHSRPRRRTGGA